MAKRLSQINTRTLRAILKQILGVTQQKTGAIRSLTSHLKNTQVRQTKHAEHC